MTYSGKNAKNVPIDLYLISKYFNYNNGIFIEVGGADGILQSNTKLLEENGWKGILIEPSKILFDKIKYNRKCIHYNCALVDFNYLDSNIRGDFHGNLMSSVNGNRLDSSNLVSVPCMTLQKILDMNNTFIIDFLSLDVEGYEFNVLNGIDFKKTIIKYILVEIYEKDFNLIKTFLESHQFILIENISGFNKYDCPNWDGTHNDYLFKRSE